MPRNVTVFDLLVPESDVPSGLPLVAGLTGMVDAGSAVSRSIRHLTERLETDVIGRFRTDELYDYRARRPVMSFDGTHLSAYEAPELTLALARDDAGTPFLLLSGFEPDFRWEAFSDAVLDIVDRFDVVSTSWVHSIGMPTPHTRPIGTTVSGNRTEIIDALSLWRPETNLPGSAFHLAEYRLDQEGHPVVGFVLLIPHYLAETVHPDAAVAALQSLAAATGLLLPTDELREEGREFLARVEDQVRDNDELAQMVRTLEKRHDAYLNDNPLPSPLTDSSGSMPTADQLADELQRFLATAHRDEDDDTPAPGAPTIL